MILRSLVRALDRRRRSALVAAAVAFLLGLAFAPGAFPSSTARARVLLHPSSPWTPQRAADILLSDPVLSATGASDLSAYRARLRVSAEPGAVGIESSAATAGGAVERVNAAAKAFAERGPALLQAEQAAEAGRLDALIAARGRELAALPRPAVAGLRDSLTAAEEQLRSVDLEIARLSSLLEKGAEGPAPLVMTAASDTLAAQVESVRRRLAGLEALYPADWPPVMAAAAELEDLRIRLQQARLRESLEARFAPVRETIDRLRKLGARRDQMAREVDVLRTQAAALPPTGGEGLEETRAALRADVRRLQDLRARHPSAAPEEPALVDRVEPAAGAESGRSSIPWLAGLALLVGALVAWAVERLDSTIRTEHDIRAYVNLPLLGVIPHAPREDDRLVLHADPRSRLVEPFNTAAALLEGRCAEAGAKLVAVTSARPGNGKSTVAANLAVSLARGLARVLLVDADLRRPSQHRLLGLAEATGLSSYLTGAADVLDQVLVSTEMENLTVLPAGPALQNPIPFLRSERLRVVLPELRERFDFVIVDLPPVRSAADTLILAPALDGVLLVLGAGETGKDDATASKRLLRDARGKLLGCVLNKATVYSRGYYSYAPASAADAR